MLEYTCHHTNTLPWQNEIPWPAMLPLTVTYIRTQALCMPWQPEILSRSQQQISTAVQEVVAAADSATGAAKQVGRQLVQAGLLLLAA